MSLSEKMFILLILHIAFSFKAFIQQNIKKKQEFDIMRCLISLHNRNINNIHNSKSPKQMQIRVILPI